jgi:anti-sigma regulatory factor (Ser/Thr protein kinase)
MYPDEPASTDGERSAVDSVEVDRLRALCRRQALVIDTLRDALSNFRLGATALKAHNADLRAENERMRGRAGVEPMEVRLPLDARAAGAARIVVERCLQDRAATVTLDTAKLLITELVTNAFRHSDAPADDPVVVRVVYTDSVVLLEVQDRGLAGKVAAGRPDFETGHGFGLHLVQALSDRWGVEHVAAGGTRVWAQIPRAPVISPPRRRAVARQRARRATVPATSSRRRPSRTATR